MPNRSTRLILFWILLFAAFFWGAGCAPSPASSLPPSISNPSTQRYTVKQQITLRNEGSKFPEKQNLWVALIHDLSPYQEVHSRKISPRSYTLFTDEFGNEYAEFDLSDHPPGTDINIQVKYEVSVNELVYNLGTCEGEQLTDAFTQPELHIESGNPQIVELSQKLSRGQNTVCGQVRAFYDYAGDELFYSFNRYPWGAQATFGTMGADCTEYASLVIALSRAQGIPARYYEGLLYTADKEEEIAQTEHAWLDVSLPGIGWVAIDPTMGRWPSYRETYFAHYTPDHIIVTTGRNPSTLRGASYWSHLYWPGDTTKIRITDAQWIITPK